MSVEKLRIYHSPELTAPTLILGFSGWMDGGDVSTGSVEYMRVKLGAVPFASIEPNSFYVYNIPGTMEMASMFRPHVKISDGLIQNIDMPSNTFCVDAEHNLILFIGKEPNLDWQGFADCVFKLCDQYGVRQILFAGSVAGLLPHTREPRIAASISQDSLREKIEQLGIRLSQYEGPASFLTYMTARVAKNDIDMVVLVAEIPAYLEGYNPKCVETIVRCMSSLLELHLPCDDLRTMGDEFEKRVSQLVEQQPELQKRVKQLEEIYDTEVFDTEMGDLKSWLQRQGIRLD